jgi:hypothetical protein
VTKNFELPYWQSDPESCPAFDRNADDLITVDELVSAVDTALHGCR